MDKVASILDVRVECQELEKFSVINRFAKFHIRQADSFSNVTPAPKPFPQRYVIAHPIPRNLPEGLQCLSLWLSNWTLPFPIESTIHLRYTSMSGLYPPQMISFIDVNACTMKEEHFLMESKATQPQVTKAACSIWTEVDCYHFWVST